MQLKTNVILGLVATVLFGHSAHATDVHLLSVNIDSVAVVQLQFGGHQSGDMEVKLTTPYDPRQFGLNCYDGQYLTTLRTDDSDKRMFELLNAARLSDKPVTLWITDDPAHTAYAGRCSIEAVEF